METVQVHVADEADLPEASGTFHAVVEEVSGPTEEIPVHAAQVHHAFNLARVQKALIYDELKIQLEKLHKPWIDEFSLKLDTQ